MLKRPHDSNELQKREAIGVIRASRFIRKYAHSRKKISVQTLKEIHKEIFRDAWSEIAGKYRQENVEITDSNHMPPHYNEIPQLMEESNRELKEKLAKLKITEGTLKDKKQRIETISKEIEKIIFLAGWIHHMITYIHPFYEGNGRAARLGANLILERFGLTGISIKIEKENKDRYRQALAQIDKVEDYEPLIDLINEGLADRYDGLAVKYYEFK